MKQAALASLQSLPADLWCAAQLAPGEGIEDALGRIQSLLEPVEHLIVTVEPFHPVQPVSTRERNEKVEAALMEASECVEKHIACTGDRHKSWHRLVAAIRSLRL